MGSGGGGGGGDFHFGILLKDNFKLLKNMLLLMQVLLSKSKFQRGFVGMENM